MEIVEFLIKYESVISLNALEQKLSIPQSTLQKAVKGTRQLPKKWEVVLIDYFNEMNSWMKCFSDDK